MYFCKKFFIFCYSSVGEEKKGLRRENTVLKTEVGGNLRNKITEMEISLEERIAKAEGAGGRESGRAIGHGEIGRKDGEIVD